MRVDTPEGFNPAALEVIGFLGGDRSTGMCFCPCHDDGEKPSLQVNNGNRAPVVVHCFGIGTKEHDLEVVAYLKANRKWPTSSGLSRDQSSSQAEKARSPKNRLRYALKIWKELRRSQRDRDLRHLLDDYLQRRGIKNVPETALVVVPMEYPEAGVAAHDPGMVLPVRNKDGKFRGIHVIWLNADMTAKREATPQRQSYGLLKGNFIQLTKIDWDNPPPKLIIAEGPETALAMTQLTGVPAIATGGKGFVADVEPPRCSEYIIGVDNDEDGGSRKAAGELAQRLVGCVVRIAMPDKPEGGKKGYDWNDALIDAGADESKLAKLVRSMTEAPSFEAVMTEVEKREERINALAALKAEDHLAYEQERQKAANSLKIRVLVLDEEVDRRVGLLAKRQAVPPPPVDMELFAASAREIIASEDVLALFATEIGRFIVGEEKNTKILYLVCTSRLFNKTMHAAVKGPSSGGKSESRDRVVDFFPREHVIEFTALSEKALLYMEEGFEHKILSMGEAMSPEEAKFQDYLLRELMSNGKLRYPVAQKVGDKIVTIMIEKDGPVSFLVTTTRNKLNPENETRMLSLEVNDTEEQTKAVIGKVAEVVGLNKEMVIEDIRPWHDYQRWLAAGECRVIVPYAQTLARLIKETKTVRLRRDFSQLLIAIKTLALLHRDHRKRSRKGEIVATIKGDYAAARDLMADLLATASEIKMRETIEDTIAAVRIVAARRPNPEIDGATVRQVANELELDRSAVHRRLKAAESEGHIVNLENRKGAPARYKPTADGGGGLMHKERPGELLPTPGALRRAYKAERAAERRCPRSPPNTPAQVHRKG
jgi:phage/plasmid primase-like uncharacterized protein